MVKVYVLLKGEYCGTTDEGYIFGIYSTRERAEEVVRQTYNKAYENRKASLLKKKTYKTMESGSSEFVEKPYTPDQIEKESVEMAEALTPTIEEVALDTPVEVRVV